MAHVTRIFDKIDIDHPEKPRERKLLFKESDLMIALNHYAPGARNEFHYHKGSSQSFLCVKGKLTVRTKDSEDAEPATHYLTEGMCVLIPGNQFYQLHNESEAPALLYQVKRPGDQIVVAGKGQLTNSDYFTEDRQAQVAL
jgi:mannose-6-phosphate isomerase-like protein (cupin superfamily)